MSGYVGFSNVGAGGEMRAMRGILRTKIQRLVLLGVLVGGLLVALAAPASAATNQISGVAVFDSAPVCPDPPAGYGDFTNFTQVMTGSLVGCWYTHILTTHDNGAPSGVYIESGEEIFVGSLNGGPDGTFTTTYQFESKWDPDVKTGSEVHGRCQHPIVAGSGTGGFEGATGRVDFKDQVTIGQFFYRGHIEVAGATARQVKAATAPTPAGSSSTAPSAAGC